MPACGIYTPIADGYGPASGTSKILRGKAMRSILVISMFTASLVFAAGSDYEEVRDLSLDTRGIDTLSIDTGAGSLDVVGVSGSAEITVIATIQVPEDDADKARKRIENNMVLTLDKDSDTAVLKAYFEQGMFGWGGSPAIQVEVHMPDGLHLDIDDGSGSIEVSGVHGDVSLDDGSGSITMSEVGGEVEIEDGSGSISVRGVGGSISINDGSGSIKVRGVAGSVIVDDGSGSIDVSDVEEDLIIVDDGSGGLDFSNIGGRVEKES